ncbi:d10d493d-7733-4ca6-866c-186fe9bfdcee [Sclerotinia trifoliorum]|uniref:DNA (cytosine-5-)-methyltransferase n=1 Tax=Sclerotinia trifoliorum TaxID=28548 RepID=A0A8H2VTL9_9HELO|nr:d10d493d-7733-4ca6-866c-186fe9bfdcee [Sclerotinia trifoliorum]
MDQAIVIDDDDVVMIEKDDRDEVFLLEREPSNSSKHFPIDDTIRYRNSQPVPREDRPQKSTHRSHSGGSADPRYSTHLPSIDLTTAVTSSNPTVNDSNTLKDRICSVLFNQLELMPEAGGYELSRSWNIALGAGTNKEMSDLTDLATHPTKRERDIAALDEVAPEPRDISYASIPERRYSNTSLISILDDGDGDELAAARDATRRADDEIVLIEDDDDGDEISIAHYVPLRADDDIILIEDNEDLEFKLETQLLEQPEFYYLCSATVNEKPKPKRKPKVHPLRNPPITNPYFECGTYLHENFNLRPKKTIELEDGDFVYIKHIVKYVKPEDGRGTSVASVKNPSIMIRGLRLQRCKFLNGMLERKMNEVCLCYEIDLDDPREPEEQSLVEVPLTSIKALRGLHWTNHNYPEHRNLNRDDFANDQDAYDKGGLTVRWKYCCTYASASAREQNIYAERTLERITEEWLSSVHGSSRTHRVSNTQLRTEWRGETIPGGTYVPECYELNEEDDSTTQVEQPRDSAMTDDIQSPFKSVIILNDDYDGASPPLRSQQFETDGVQVKRKSDFPSSSDIDSDQENQPAKKVRQVSKDRVEMIRQRLGRVMLSFNGKDYVKQSYNIGTSSGVDISNKSSKFPSPRRQLRHTGSSARGTGSKGSIRPKVRNLSTSQRCSPPGSQNTYSETSLSGIFSSILSPKIPRQIDITSSELASPPPIGVIDLSSSTNHSYSSSLVQSNVSISHSLKEPRTLSHGQTLTYGDAFCGAGGTTRGAVMAGLRVKWGFDFDHHACTTWRLNFPYATCYEMSSDRFVALATPSPYSSFIPNDVKVDVLHLSPPCQYFSPAHTQEGKNDEMNTASLFAVAAVIKVAKPRVVTLEQTFGILYPRFRGYFSSLILMFTSCGFSLRWAIVPLAQWGVPQRRFRLIIIASCPGEPLPPMPPPTHSSPSSPLPNTHPFKTVYQTLREIPPYAANHSPHLLPEKDLKAYNPHAILSHTMTTSGSENWHPSGKRGFTDREFACLQGFPLQHRFEPNGIKRQIGNAVPPVVAKVLFEGIRRFMEGTDGIVGSEHGGGGGGGGDGGASDAMDVCEKMEGVETVDGDTGVDILVKESNKTDEDKLAGIKRAVKPIVID